MRILGEEQVRKFLPFSKGEKNLFSFLFSEKNIIYYLQLVSQKLHLLVEFKKEGTKDKESSCDGMLTFAQNLYLVELKKQGTGGWISDAKGQLENTIKLISENHDLSNFRYKKAFACNRKHPSFTVIDTAERKSFFERTGGFRIDVQAEIVVK